MYIVWCVRDVTVSVPVPYIFSVPKAIAALAAGAKSLVKRTLVFGAERDVCNYLRGTHTSLIGSHLENTDSDRVEIPNSTYSDLPQTTDTSLVTQ